MLYVALGLTPSHYGVGFKQLGIDEGPILGTARPIRSDEWIVLTPLFQIAVLGEFSPIDMISPYHESLKGFMALPILDWSLIFKPQVWGFWLLPPGHAYSFYYAFMWATFLSGYTILLRQLGASTAISALGSVILFFSHFVQVWWTTGPATYSFAAWPLIIFLSPLRPWVKGPLLFWTSSVWIFGFVYPGTIIPTAFVLAVLLVALRRDALTINNIIAGGIAVIAVGIAFFLYFGDLISTMAGTVYPGERWVGGGGVPESKILAHLLPFFTTSQFDALLANSNECEIAVVSTLLPLALLVFVRYSSILDQLNKVGLSAYLIVGALILMLGWMVLPVPASWGAPLLWPVVPPKRMSWAFGLLLTLSLVVLGSRLRYNLTPLRLAIFGQILVAAWLVSKIGFTEVWPTVKLSAWAALSRSWFDLLPLLPFGLATFVVLSRSVPMQHHASLIFLAAALSGLATFGTFNPVQQAHAIFDLPDSDFQRQIRQNARSNPNGWAVVPGGYGALLNGAGIPAINHTLPTPQFEFFRRVFPEMSEGDFRQAFNRYAHVIPVIGGVPHSPSADVVHVPVEPFLRLVPKRGPATH
ncbi:hypothetical protein U0023_15340 [Microvirga lotononidis]|uniref:DUF7657 domain-containing protein n=1 Tax=Microvirga lotononidis TaxID=864069 RepID=UPI0012B6198F|nr:hypothetical protein [Microvirga lotononidis]WQO26075.1 hypothetical protein U0023_15340 [Microvirga lotononidis]